ncbi:hypothetical protein [Enterococcus sp. DIV0086]
MTKKKQNEIQPLPSEPSQVEKLEKENRMIKLRIVGPPKLDFLI